MEQEAFYIGIDLSDRCAMVSFYQPNSSGEPETVSEVAGSERYQIPLILAKRKGLSQWYYGEEAQRMAKTCEMICVDNLLHRAVTGEHIQIESESYLGEELLLIFLQKIIALPHKLGGRGEFTRLVITVERLNRENMELFWKMAQELELTGEQFMVIDHKESFYFFALNQQKELWLHDVFLFGCEQNGVYFYGLERNTKTRPQVISIEEGERRIFSGDRDEAFLPIVQDAFANRIISSVYLVGEGFEGDWMKKSLNFICRGRRAFVGKNLFSKGACYAAAVRDQETEWEYIYMGENEMKFNLSLKVVSNGQQQFYNLVSAGKNWFEASGECEVILNDSVEINFWKQLPSSREARIEALELTDLPKRPDRTTRLRITASPVADDKIEIAIRDLGFGEFFRSTGKTWKYTMSI